jgi:hypothetical protein
MKKCTIIGDMTADSAADQYPTVILCDDCAEARDTGDEDSTIMSIESIEADDDDECHDCGVTAAEEAGN